MNLYIFNDGCVGFVYGVGTYIRELIIALKDSDLNICIVNILLDKSRILRKIFLIRIRKKYESVLFSWNARLLTVF